MLSYSDKAISVQHRLPRLQSARYQDITPLTGWQIVDGLDADAPLPADDDPRWRPITAGEAWGSPGRHAWLRVELPAQDGRPLPVLLLALFDYRQPPADPLGLNGLMRPEALVYVDGAAVQAVNRGHSEVRLEGARGGRLTVHAACGYTRETRVFARADLAILDADADALYWDAHVLAGLIDGALPEPDAAPLLDALYEALNHVDWRGYPRIGNTAAARAHLRGTAFVPRPDDAPLIHAVGHAHIDLGWLWPLSFSPGKGVRTAYSQLDFIERFPGYTFLQSQPWLYRAMEQANPAQFARVVDAIRAGRWNATGATWVEPDMNLISGESLARQFLHGMRYFMDRLGVRPRVLWLPDTFGYNAQIPQIMALSGVPYFFTSKMSWNTTNKLPHDTFRWRGLDGSEVLAHMATTHRKGQSATCYEGSLTPYEAANTWQSYRDQALNRHTLVAYGYGDGGGGPDRDTLERLERYNEGIVGMPALHPGTAEGFFAALEAGLTRPLPVWAGELYFELHRGCYTSQGRTKWYNRKLEAALHDAEFILTWAHVAAGLDYPRDALRHAWDVLLTHQFHDILPGSSIRETYIEAEAAYADALALTEMLIHEGLVTLAATSGGQWAVVNTLGHARRALAVITADLRAGDRLVDDQGETCVWQALDDGRALVLADLPAFGMRALRVEAGAQAVESDLSASPQHLENAAMRVEFDGDGRITRVYDKVAAREALPEGAIANHFQLYQDMPARWQAWDIDADYEELPLPDPLPQGVRVIESGPVRAAVEVTYAFGASTIRQQISLTSGSRALDFDTEIDWHERHTLLKVAFPLDLQAARATFESAYGAVERPTHRSTPWDAARFEVPALRWADLSEAGYGAALLNDCKYGYDVRDNVLRLSLLRAPTMPDPEADQGQHHIRYALLLHDGGWQSGGVVAEAAALNQPARVVTLKGAGDALPVAPVVPEAGSAVIVDTVKLAEESGDVIVRLYEPHGARQRVSLRTAGGFTGVHEVNILEEAHDGGDLMVEGDHITLTLRPYQVRTLRLTR